TTPTACSFPRMAGRWRSAASCRRSSAEDWPLSSTRHCAAGAPNHSEISMSLLDRLAAFLSGEEAPSADGDGLRLAVAALLVEAARMDDEFVPSERAAIRRLLGARFALGPAASEQLLALAERAEAKAAGLYRFTKSVIEGFSPKERIELI